MRRFVALVLFAVLALPGSSGAAVDFGDAPQGATARYPGASPVLGSFPTRAGGPQHANGNVRLGRRHGRDDGVAVRSLRRCAQSVVMVLLDVRRLPKSQRRGDLVVNAWFDFDRDGSWDDAGCAVEWAIQNHHVPMSRLGSNGVLALPIAFTGGDQVDELWYRVTVTAGADLTEHTGAVAARLATGETEDYLRRAGRSTGRMGSTRRTLRPRTGKAQRNRARRAQTRRDFDVECVPSPAVVAHGATTRIAFRVFDGNPTGGALLAEYSRNMLFSNTFRTTLNRSQNQTGAPRGRVNVDSFDFTSRKKHQVPANLVIESRSVDFFIRRPGSGSMTLRCPVEVIHERIPPKPDKPKPPKPPPPKPVDPGPGVAVPPAAPPAPPAPPAQGWKPKGDPIKIEGTPGNTGFQVNKLVRTPSGAALAIGHEVLGGQSVGFVREIGGSTCGGDGVVETPQIESSGITGAMGPGGFLYIAHNPVGGGSETNLLRMDASTCSTDAIYGSQTTGISASDVVGDSSRICALGTSSATMAARCFDGDKQLVGDALFTGWVGSWRDGRLADGRLWLFGEVFDAVSDPTLIAGRTNLDGSADLGWGGARRYGTMDFDFVGGFDRLGDGTFVYGASALEDTGTIFRPTWGSMFAFTPDGEEAAPYQVLGLNPFERTFVTAVFAAATANAFVTFGYGDLKSNGAAKLFIATYLLENRIATLRDQLVVASSSDVDYFAFDVLCELQCTLAAWAYFAEEAYWLQSFEYVP